jgi:NAD(P)-dependent dehydrogenase (short-subunit alcohol dehydrogenase family)
MKGTVLILGATSSIARHVAAALARRGADVTILARSAARLDRQAESLRALGCDLGQGFYFARPQAPEAAEAFLQAEKMAEAFVDSRERRTALRLVSGSGA